MLMEFYDNGVGLHFYDGVGRGFQNKTGDFGLKTAHQMCEKLTIYAYGYTIHNNKTRGEDDAKEDYFLIDSSNDYAYSLWN